MLQNYIDTLKQLTSGFSEKDVSFMDCLLAIKLGFLLLFILIFIIVAIFGIYYVPKKVSQLVIKKDIETAKDSEDGYIYSAALDAIKKKRIIVAILCEILYLPVSIPICIYIVGLLAG